MKLRVACIQFAPVKAEVDRNLDRIAELYREAVREGAEMIVFPEAATSGYFLEGGVTQAALTTAELVEALDARLGAELIGKDLIVGFFRRGNDGEIYNSALHINQIPGAGAQSTRVHIHDKLFLPTYGVFDEERFVGRGRELETFEVQRGNDAQPTSILICEDIWHSITPTIAALKGAHLMVVPAASPARGFEDLEISNHEMYRRICRSISAEHGVFVVNAQLVGFEGGKGLVGGSIFTDPFGHVIAEGPVGKEAIVVADLDFDLISIARTMSPMLSDLQTMWPRMQKLMGELE